MELDQYIEAAGFDPGSLSDAQRSALASGWKHDLAQAVTAQAANDIEAVYERYADGRDAATVTRLQGALEQARSESWDVQRTELEMLRASRPTGNFVAASGGSGVREGEVLTAAVCRTIGLSDGDLGKMFDARTLEAAGRPEYRGASLHTLFARDLRAAGLRVPAKFGDSDIRTCIQLSVRAAGSWGPSTEGASFSSVLSNVANKSLLAAYNAVPAAWRAIAHKSSLPDFKAGSAYRMTFKGSLAKVPPGGEIHHGQIDAESFANTLDTYARMLGLDRRALINDDLSALSNVPGMMGRKAAIAVEKVVFTLFANNGSFYTAGRNNLLTGGGSVLALAGLNAAIAKLRAQVDSDSDPIMVEPAILLVPPALEATAKQLVADMALIGAPTTPGPSANPWAGTLKVVVSPYLGAASGLTGASDTAWYVLPMPGDYSPVDVAFLDGRETPTVETSDSDFGMLGQAWRVFFDFAANFLDYRGSVKNAGA